MIQKLVATIIIISLILSVGFNIFLFKPKKAQAIFGIADITAANLVDDLKEWVLDEIPRRIARHMMLRLQNEVIRWAQGGYTDENKPFALLRWKDYFIEALDFASAKFIQDFNLTPICAPFRFTIGQRLGIAQPHYILPPYRIYAACSIGRVIDNVEAFWQNPSISAYGWNVWDILSQPQNNFLGSVLLAAQRKAELQDEEVKEKEVQKDTGQGYMNEQECIREAGVEECIRGCEDNAPYTLDPDVITTYMEECEAECQRTADSGICLEYRTKNIGSTIHSAIEKALGSDIDWLLTADEITMMFNLVFSKLFNKLYHGTGLAAQPYYRAAQTSVAKYQAQYGYYNEYKKTQTSEDIHELRRNVLDNILRAVKNTTTNNYECEKDYQLTGEVYQELAAEMIEEESQHLYVGYEGINLKPDYEVLDPSNAPFTVFGTTWSEIPFSKYPEQCENIAGTRCPDIITNLPYELDKSNILDGNCSDCLGRINELREICKKERDNCLAQCPVNDTVCSRACRDTYTTCENNSINTAVSENRCANFAYGSTCLSGAKLIDKTQNRCDTCVEVAQKRCENIEDASERDSCIELYCSDYEDIEDDWGQTFTDAQDFYNRCQQAEIRDACYVCLKEYFMPAKYCAVAYDFVNRAFIKYPAQAYEDLWWGEFNKFDSCAGNRTSPGTVFTGLICRIFPDYNGGTLCRSSCDATEEELKDIFDDQPRDDECSPFETYTGGFHPGGQYLEWLARKRVKCCAGLLGHEPELYKACRGQQGGEAPRTECDWSSTYSIQQTPWCMCNEGERPILWVDNWEGSRINNGIARSFYSDGDGDFITDGQTPNGVANPCGIACSSETFRVPDMNRLDEAYIFSNAAPAGGTIYLAPSGCRDSDSAGCSTLGTDCDYMPTRGPQNAICSAGSRRSPASQGHCQPWTSDGSGGVRDTCGGLSAYRNQDLDIGIWNRDPEDGITAVQLCIPCDPNDPGYPFYGVTNDEGRPVNQCANKN